MRELKLEEKHPIILSIIFNTISIVVKNMVFEATGSRAVFSEIFHSLGDAANSLTLYLGARIYRAKPSPRYPFGMGRALYISSLFSSIILSGSIFYMIVAENVRLLSAPRAAGPGLWSPGYWVYILLLTLFDVSTMAMALRIMRRSMISTALAPLVLEDLMGIGGNVLAAVSVYLSNPSVDLYLSSLIAFIILAGSVHVGYRSIEALLGHSAPREVVARVIKIALSVPGVVDVNDVKTMAIDPGKYLAIVQVEVDEDKTVKEAEEIKEEIVEAIRGSMAEIKYLVLDIVRPREPPRSYESLLRDVREI